MINKLNELISGKMNSFKKTFLNNANDLIIDYQNVLFYVIWDEESLPVIQCDFYTIIQQIECVTAVSFDTWLVNDELNVYIEFNHDGNINLYTM